METATIVLAVLSSSLLSSVLTSLVSVQLQRRQFRDQYYSEVFQRRLDAYESLDRALLELRSVTYDDDKQPYHLFLQNGEQLTQFCIGIGRCTAGTIWLEQGTRDLVLDLNKLLIRVGESVNSASDYPAAGVKHYEQLAKLRDKIDKSIHSDLLRLHDVARFLRRGAKRKSGPWIPKEDIFGDNEGEGAGA